jgi:superfamily II DNA helicase RecQ
MMFLWSGRGGRGSFRRTGKWSAECYHAGLTPMARKTIQEDFMCGRLRIVVATVAFGMGLNKRDIHAIIHYTMPKNIESYVQEIGRAGRDGETSYCHLFLDCKVNDLFVFVESLVNKLNYLWCIKKSRKHCKSWP